jgi:acetyl esterase/lipase
MVGGDSSGGSLAAVSALRARDRGRPALALQVLVYPATDHDTTTASYVEHGAGALVGRQEMEWFWDHYIVDVAQREDSEVSPLRAPDVSKLPPAIVAVAEYDPRNRAQGAHGQPCPGDFRAEVPAGAISVSGRLALHTPPCQRERSRRTAARDHRRPDHRRLAHGVAPTTARGQRSTGGAPAVRHQGGHTQ